jgi:hypothetical protein
MLILRTAWSILALNLGRHSFALPPEFVEAQRILEAQRRAGAKAEFLV